MKDKVLGCLYGMAIGDAMGMPSEFWSRRKIKEYFGEIKEFLDGPEENDIAMYYKKGEYTDDTHQAVVILNSLIEDGFKVNSATIAKNLTQWAIDNDAFNKNILGPSSKAALLAIKEGKDATVFTSKAETNGAAMRIAPIGCLFESDNKGLLKYVADISKTTHATDVAIGGACMIASAVSAAMDDKSWDEIIKNSFNSYEEGRKLGFETSSPSLRERAEVGIYYAEKYKDNEEAFVDKIFNVIGAGVQTSESVPAAIAVAYYAKTPEKCSILCANLGGDTDTVGAMAAAICGAKVGIRSIRKDYIKLINESNNIDFTKFADAILKFRNNI
ncbi:MAG: ADP-ribosylglycohydrolase family protein [Clostridium sp.]|uniref:ADP-ribosylglycohydrolase family protein n=1 Tax=Clostridium sp. TaxID=1506 RepID=UPI002FC7D98F